MMMILKCCKVMSSVTTDPAVYANLLS